jgi:hemerythrin superfamily protein
MKAVVCHGIYDVRVQDVPEPEILDPRDAIVKVTATAICGSDLHQSLMEWQAHHQEEILELDGLIQEIRGLDPTTDQWREKIEELQETLAHHMDEEEGDVWPRIQQAWDEAKLEQTGQQMATLKRQTMPRAA